MPDYTLIFLDIDGVLNDHKPLPNHYAQLNLENVFQFCLILEALPEAKIVVSSAWRYMIHSGAVGPRGLEYLFCLFGANFSTVDRRIIGWTETDEETCVEIGLAEPGALLDYQWLKENGCELRALQIERYVASLDGDVRFVVLDDLDLGIPELIQTDGEVGLTPKEARDVVFKLGVPLSRRSWDSLSKLAGAPL